MGVADWLCRTDHLYVCAIAAGGCVLALEIIRQNSHAVLSSRLGEARRDFGFDFRSPFGIREAWPVCATMLWASLRAP
jgi:hypothetical protein